MHPSAGKHHPGRDDGVTLVGLLVAVGIILFLTTLVTSALVVIHRTVATTQAIAGNIHTSEKAMLTLGHQITGALAISKSGLSGSYWYIEWTSSTPGVADCVQTRVGSGVIEQRTWNVNGGQREQQTGWHTLVDGVTQAGNSPVFDLHTPTLAKPHQSVTVKINAGNHGAYGGTNTVAKQTFVTMHTRIDTKLNTTCIGNRA